MYVGEFLREKFVGNFIFKQDSRAHSLAHIQMVSSNYDLTVDSI